MRDAANNHDAHEKADRKDGGDAGVRVVREKVIPLVKDIAEAVGNEDGEWEKDEDGGFGVETGEEDCENDEPRSNGDTRGEETFGSGE